MELYLFQLIEKKSTISTNLKHFLRRFLTLNRSFYSSKGTDKRLLLIYIYSNKIEIKLLIVISKFKFTWNLTIYYTIHNLSFFYLKKVAMGEIKLEILHRQ